MNLLPVAAVAALALGVVAWFTSAPWREQRSRRCAICGGDGSSRVNDRSSCDEHVRDVMRLVVVDEIKRVGAPTSMIDDVDEMLDRMLGEDDDA